MPLKEREKLTFKNDKEKKNFFKIVLAHEAILEMIILSTCNRTEFILYVKEYADSLSFLLHNLSFFSDIKVEELKKVALLSKETKAIEHIFRVSSSLESMVIGETQITGQLKEAYQFSFANEFCSKGLSKLIHYAFKCAAIVRNKTDISKESVSIASVAINALRDKKKLRGAKVLVIGTGEMSRLAIKYCLDEQCEITLINRTLENTKALAEEFGEAITISRFEKLPTYINTHNIILTATSSQEPIINASMIKSVDFERYWFDMALPQDIDTKDIGNRDKNEHLNIYNIDDLEKMIAQNKDAREQQALIAQMIIDECIGSFLQMQENLDVIPLIKTLRKRAKTIYNEEVSYAIKKGYISRDNDEVITKMLDRAFKKFLHQPTKNLKKVGNKYTNNNIGELCGYLFDEEPSINLLPSKNEVF